jgi:hypothetical protein
MDGRPTMELNGRTEDIHGNHTGYFYIEFPLRDLFAAFALAGMNAESVAVSGEAIHERARRAYGFANAALSAGGTDE